MGQPYLVAESLTLTDLQRLTANEQIIERGLQTFYEVGSALAAIRDDGLYASTHNTFEDYCRERWGMSRIHAWRLIEATETRDNLLPTGNILPSSEWQIRPLTGLDPDRQREAWQRSVDAAPDGRVTRAHVERVVDEMTRPPASEPDLIITAPVAPMAVHFSSSTPEWYTPSHIVDLVIGFFDQIDLDPCSNSHESPNVPAGATYTEADDGLKQPWFGRVYMNPPYGDEIMGWVKKLHEEYQNGDIEAAIALLPARMDTRWWNDYVMPYAMCFIRGRLKFVGADNSAPFPSVLVYYGDEIERFTAATATIGRVVTVFGHTPGDRLLEDMDE